MGSFPKYMFRSAGFFVLLEWCRMRLYAARQSNGKQKAWHHGCPASCVSKLFHCCLAEQNNCHADRGIPKTSITNEEIHSAVVSLHNVMSHTSTTRLFLCYCSENTVMCCVYSLAVVGTLHGNHFFDWRGDILTQMEFIAGFPEYI